MGDAAEIAHLGYTPGAWRWYASIMKGRGVEDRPGPTVRGTDGDHGTPFGAMLKRLRDAAGLTQEELAQRAGLTAKAVSALERGERRRPYPHTVRSLSDALG
ncbi:MAG: helix-turn-helix domain-containing protein, partial [Actinomycetota bacterium]|nr:helix-turn-helix domain-containing protein [Actinomycetota bacterium]